ncbi:MAG: hypothetical protein SPL40_05930, partial [Erysipelotrichaceae bacterium]|nr:hypothetical protein [Erysipelotrichaceae bacterium]
SKPGSLSPLFVVADQKNSEAYEFIEEISEKRLDLSYQIFVGFCKKYRAFHAQNLTLRSELCFMKTGTNVYRPIRR